MVFLWFFLFLLFSKSNQLNGFFVPQHCQFALHGFVPKNTIKNEIASKLFLAVPTFWFDIFVHCNFDFLVFFFCWFYCV